MRTPSALLVLCAGAAAQGALVSPTTNASAEGNAASSIPWSSATPYRFQQVHSDISGAPFVCRGLSFRQDGGAASAFTGTRTFDVEMRMGRARRADFVSYVFAVNHTAGSTVVLARRIVNLGPPGAPASPGPSAFEGMDIAFDTPFAYDGVASLGWEAAVFANVGSGTFATTDAVSRART